MKRFILIAPIVSILFFSANGRADLFGGDVAVLSQILANSVIQLAKLKEIVSTGSDTLNLIQEIHKGINDSITVFKDVPRQTQPGIYGDWKDVDEAVRQLRDIYGIVVPSPESKVEGDTDQSVAEAIALNNSLYEYTQNIDGIGDEVRKFSDNVSPAWSPKVTAQTLGIMLQVLNQSLRAQATGLKLQAQTIALQNHRDKELTKDILSNSEALDTSMKNRRCIVFGAKVLKWQISVG